MSRVRRYSRSGPTGPHPRSPTGLSPPAVTRSSGLRLKDTTPARALPPPPVHSFNPPLASPAGCAASRVWAPPRSLAATKGILSVPRGTEMFQFPRCPPRSKPGCPAVRRAGCPIRTSPDRRLPAPPRGISPRGRVLPRPPTPRHPPCAHHADILRPFPTGCCRDHASRPARASGTVPSSQSLPAAALPRSPVGSWCVFVCFCTVLCLRWYVTVRAGEQTRTPAPHRSPGVEQDSGHDAPSRRPSDAVGSSPSPAAAEPSGFRVAHCQGARRPDRRPDDAPVVPTTQRSSCLRGRQTSSEAVLRPRTRSPNPYAVA
jgi:hypothetical protein